jgi:hypothetical protein
LRTAERGNSAKLSEIIVGNKVDMTQWACRDRKFRLHICVLIPYRYRYFLALGRGKSVRGSHHASQSIPLHKRSQDVSH